MAFPLETLARLNREQPEYLQILGGGVPKHIGHPGPNS
jgi:hypothetical protein